MLIRFLCNFGVFFYFALFCTTALNFCSVIAQKCKNKNYSTEPAWKRKNKPNHTRNESHWKRYTLYSILCTKRRHEFYLITAFIFVFSWLIVGLHYICFCLLSQREVYYMSCISHDGLNLWMNSSVAETLWLAPRIFICIQSGIAPK